EFVVNVSHELRTPLTIFKNIVSNLLSGVAGRINEKQRESLEIANKEVGRLSRIINDFLDISRIEAGILLNRENVLVQSLINDVVELLTPLADQKKVALSTSMYGADLFINVDRDRMIQVIANLINNAIKFVPDVGGRITVRAKELGDEVCIAVEDNGLGIEPDDIEKVFNRFVQVEKHVGPGSHGTGLGLAISKELVELHGGRIEATSEIGGGTTFSVFMQSVREFSAV
ncbi:MAG TPA: sensor histidine kinase, partial [Planctomycetes bacterium]|nr:sensor histidine kinase [Planctomycetota bacterium]